MSSASGDSSNSRSVLDPFTRLITQIGQELRTFDVKVLKSLTVKNIPLEILNKINVKEQYSALDLFEKLREYRLLSENNLSWLKEALITANRVDLATRVVEFEKTVTELKDAPPSQMNALPASSFVLLRLLLSGPKRSLAAQRIDQLKESICQELELKPSDVPYVRSDDTTQESTSVVFQFPHHNEKVDQLNLAATNKSEWLIKLGVRTLKINGKATVNIDDNLYDQETILVQQTENLCLEMKPEFNSHCDSALDLILVIEVPFTVTINGLKQMLKQCQSAIHALAQQGFDMRLAIVTYGNHCATKATQLTAFLQQELSKEFDFAERIKNKRQCGGRGGPSGIADAFAEVVELTRKQKVCKDATKLCLLINFWVQDSTDLEHYRCSHGNDAIKLLGSLADIGIVLYIFGINVPMPQPEDQSKYEENYFLEGIAAIGGGRYFQLENVTHLNQALTCVAIHEMGIEMQGEVTGEIIIQEINNNYGVVSVNLPRHLLEKLQSIGVYAITEHGNYLKRISQIADRVAWADDLDDAMRAVKSLKEKLKFLGKPRDESTTRSCVLVPQGASYISRKKVEELSATSKHQPLVGKESQKVVDQNNIICLAEKCVDLEVAGRIVRRQLHRMAYFKRSDLKDQNQQHVDNKDIKQ